VLAVFALLIPLGCGGGGSSFPTNAPTPASVAVAFVGTGPPGNFRSVLLNISGVRLNHSFDAATNATGWVTIAVPTGAGTGNGQNPGDLQIDLLHTQTAATFFNVGGVPVGTYQTVQVLVDSTDPGTIVPACQSGASNSEGCTNYPLNFDITQPVLFTLAEPMTASANATAPLVIQLAVSITSAPANTGDPYMVTITPAETNTGSYLAAVSGNITVKGAAAVGIHLAPLTVSAELSGTNTVIETAPVKAKGAYTLELPAALSGTSYDIFTNGGGVTYGALQGISVVPGQLASGEDLTVAGATPGTMSGFIADACTGLGIPGAQLELLAPAIPLAKPRPTPPASFCLTNPGQCVVVASGSADQAGSYPLPGTSRNPSSFDEVPTGQPDLAVQVGASGYTSVLSSAFLRSINKNDVCSADPSDKTCNFSLTTGYINGTANLVSDPPPGNSVVVQVLAENSGTNQVVAALPQPLVFLNHETSLPFQLNVPLSQANGAPPAFDLFSVAIDPFQGGPDPFPGHDISVLANQPAPTAGCQHVNAVPFQPMNCVGHGSISGTVQNPDTGTSVEVEKLDPNNTPVQILGTPPALFSSDTPSNNAYTLCVPPDMYQLQRFEAAPTSSATASATPIPVGSPQQVTVPQPAATSSPCPSTCSSTDGGPAPCPGMCNATTASPL